MVNEYVKPLAKTSTVKLVAIYLPQYHPIPENDAAWGEGFTEWTNVKSATPLFEGHYQPHIPHEDIGYYDLRDPEVLVKQAAMANKYGIYGFAFYHYWFNGKLLLNTPLDNMLKLKKPDFPFLYIWANENWTRRWDGADNEIIVKQNYSLDDDYAHIRYLCENVFCDARYIKIDNKPVFIVYRPELFPSIKKTAALWRKEIINYGYDGIYLINVNSLCHYPFTDPSNISFDAAMEFSPQFNPDIVKNIHSYQKNNKEMRYSRIDYENLLAATLSYKVKFKRFRCITPAWDNAARKQKIGDSYMIKLPDCVVELFSYWASRIIQETEQNFPKNEQFVFINAWNEWGEGCHIEPDKKYGYAFLEALQLSLCNYTQHPVPDAYIHSLENYNNSIIQKIEEIKKSFSYQIGKFVLTVPRMIKALVRRRNERKRNRCRA
ncbi:MAG: glycoside hydrolase family 99-like domain-containing protein [Spirochaetaceae bacterium]|jgi:lipopolysaccharide biosynthesis protein|nr:glycoside hydrolase family 99-like domain-containing protein [Spirochaetaceae bacterium]